MTTPSTTPAPTIPPNWAPPSSASCLVSTNYWIWDYGSESDERSVLGGPSQTTKCLPEGWGSTVAYAATACPSYYTTACGKPDGVVTCCPWIYDFTCVEENWDPNNNGAMFRCSSRYTSQDVVKMTRTSFKNGGSDVETRTRQTTNHLYALAVMFTTPASNSLPVSTPTGAPPPPPPPTSGKSSGLTSGAIVGIAVGSASAVLLLGLFLLYMYRRRRAAAATAGRSELSVGTLAAYTPMVESHNLPPHMVHAPVSATPKELSAERRCFELDGTTSSHELN
ncbi:hypothetical protein F4861DRAFT_126260 [Xylaria intraflava]|nr:hypothetical protein F4861DRAFT_126260 [Xylaria intraflava]